MSSSIHEQYPLRPISNVPALSVETAPQPPMPETVITKDMINYERAAFASLCFSQFLNGWNDGSTGPLLPRMQEFYGVGFAVVSLVFISSCCGFIFAALMNVPLSDRFGFGKIIAFGSGLQMIGCAVQSAAPPFPAFAIAFSLNGFGFGATGSQANGFVALLRNSGEGKMSLLHAAYGCGAFIAPLVATQFSSMAHWSFHYLASLGLALINCIFLNVVFRLKSQEQALSKAGIVVVESGATNESGKMKQIMKVKTVHVLALFIFVYVGVEVTIGGWIVTYSLKVRGGGPSAGYIASGFFGGLMLGRIVLIWVTRKVGARQVVYMYIALCIALEITVWFVPSLIENAIAVSFVGLFLGPIYPICMTISSEVLPPWLLVGSIGWIAGIGQAGSAALPFMTGAIASKTGVRAMQPLLVGMMGGMIALWLFVPRKAVKVQ
ncbi:hypothetical protein BOTBODRAFT_37096 [Botryobasidium botryosum FD-172 SS1]|uniref:Major facilitator superfamily (MFS) profile domain-containing protein n=1 Tax=Botryobasidium botryosum (strain FD-172 SS1) TaxID=930990 RepID=A0A067M1D8_BOTB1|nr:hypothetical protein BOTBODRAFT_37096 [Botryobasidium botryosum FD-172 SS1]